MPVCTVNLSASPDDVTLGLVLEQLVSGRAIRYPPMAMGRSSPAQLFGERLNVQGQMGIRF